MTLLLLLRKEAAKHALEQAQKLAPDTPETLIALAGYQYLILRDPGAAKTTLERVSQMLPSSGEVRMYLGVTARNEGHWDQSVAYLEQALALDPRNVQIPHPRNIDLHRPSTVPGRAKAL